jgi:hypothetical protein
MHPTKYDELTNNLVFTMLGLKLVDFEAVVQDEMVKNCFEAYQEFTLDFFSQNYPEFELDKIQNINQNQLISKLDVCHLKAKLDACYNAFLVELQKSWEL